MALYHRAPPPPGHSEGGEAPQRCSDMEGVQEREQFAAQRAQLLCPVSYSVEAMKATSDTFRRRKGVKRAIS